MRWWDRFRVGRVHVSLQALGGSIHKAADLADMLLLQLVHFLMLVVELLELEGARAKLAGIIEFRNRRRHPAVASGLERIWMQLRWNKSWRLFLSPTTTAACDSGQRPLRNCCGGQRGQRLAHMRLLWQLPRAQRKIDCLRVSQGWELLGHISVSCGYPD